MKKERKEPLIFINHILESISLIEDFSKGLTKEKMIDDKLRQNAIIRQIEIVGEAVKNLPKDFVAEHPAVNWKDIAGMRDKIIHQYFDINFDIVWGVLKEDIPTLKGQIKKILEKSPLLSKI